MAKFSAEELGAIKSFASSDYSKPVMARLDLLVKRLENNLISLDLRAKSDRDLILAKAELDGARKLLNAFAEDLLKLKNAK